MPKCRAEAIIRAGNHFIRAYQYMAYRALQSGKPAFPLYPKNHMVQELVEEMTYQCNVSDFCWNILADACFQEEDMVGRVSYLTRCVSPRQQALRALQRYLAQVKVCWSVQG